jgi:hypothetical protein
MAHLRRTGLPCRGAFAESDHFVYGGPPRKRVSSRPLVITFSAAQLSHDRSRECGTGGKNTGCRSNAGTAWRRSRNHPRDSGFGAACRRGLDLCALCVPVTQHQLRRSTTNAAAAPPAVTTRRTSRWWGPGCRPACKAARCPHARPHRRHGPRLERFSTNP